MADNDPTPDDKLQKELAAYQAAIKQEYEMSKAGVPENVDQITRDFFKSNAASAAAQIVWLANNAHSESTRLAAAKTVIAEALADARAEGDPIRELLKDLAPPASTVPAIHSPETYLPDLPNDNTEDS
jgi:hypothetical protein